MTPIGPVEFRGFPAETLAFLRGITANNEKAWFEAHRDEYERYFLAPALAFISAIGPRLQAEVDPALKYEPRVNGSLFRINRDVRFSSDKIPYKTNLDMWFWYGDKKGWDAPGLFFRLTPEQLILGAGLHQFTPAVMKEYRAAVADEEAGARLSEIVTRIESSGVYEAGVASRKTVPRGFDPNHPRARFLRFESLHAMRTGGIPSELESAEFVDYCLEHFQAVQPLNLWLFDLLSTVEPNAKS